MEPPSFQQQVKAHGNVDRAAWSTVRVWDRCPDWFCFAAARTLRKTQHAGNLEPFIMFGARNVGSARVSDPLVTASLIGWDDVCWALCANSPDAVVFAAATADGCQDFVSRFVTQSLGDLTQQTLGVPPFMLSDLPQGNTASPLQSALHCLLEARYHQVPLSLSDVRVGTLLRTSPSLELPEVLESQFGLKENSRAAQALVEVMVTRKIAGEMRRCVQWFWFAGNQTSRLTREAVAILESTPEVLMKAVQVQSEPEYFRVEVESDGLGDLIVDTLLRRWHPEKWIFMLRSLSVPMDNDNLKGTTFWLKMWQTLSKSFNQCRVAWIGQQPKWRDAFSTFLYLWVQCAPLFSLSIRARWDRPDAATADGCQDFRNRFITQSLGDLTQQTLGVPPFLLADLPQGKIASPLQMSLERCATMDQEGVVKRTFAYPPRVYSDMREEAFRRLHLGTLDPATIGLDRILKEVPQEQWAHVLHMMNERSGGIADKEANSQLITEIARVRRPTVEVLRSDTALLYQLEIDAGKGRYNVPGVKELLDVCKKYADNQHDVVFDPALVAAAELAAFGDDPHGDRAIQKFEEELKAMMGQ